MIKRIDSLSVKCKSLTVDSGMQPISEGNHCIPPRFLVENVSEMFVEFIQRTFEGCDVKSWAIISCLFLVQNARLKSSNV